MAILCGYLVFAIGFFWWVNAAMKRRYGAVRPSRDEALRMQRHPVLIALNLALGVGLLLLRFVPHAYGASDVFVVFFVLIQFLKPVLDATNVPRRRVAYGIGLVVLLAGAWFAWPLPNGVWLFSLAGIVWLSLTLFDFRLLRRAFAEASGAAVRSEVTHA